MKKSKILWGVLAILSLVAKPASAQFLYATSGRASLQTATLENIMVLQNVRDSDFSCPRSKHQAWFVGYGSGGFADGYSYSRSAIEDANQLAHYDQSIGGFLLGGDKRLNDSTVAGLFFSYNDSKLEEVQPNPIITPTQTINMNNYFWGGYARKDLQNCYLLGTLAGGYSRLDEVVFYTPAILDPINGSTDSWRALAYGEIGKEYRLGRNLIQPFWGLQYFYNSYAAFSMYHEQEIAERFNEMNTNSLRNVLGIRLARNLRQSQTGFLKLDCVAFWYHEYMSRNRIGLVTTSDLTRSATTIQSGRDWAIIAPTLTWKQNNFRLWAGYIIMFNEDESINLGQGGVAYCF